MRVSRIMLPMICVVALTSGCIFDSDNDKKTDSTKKGVVSGTVKLTITSDPVMGVKVMLINRDVNGDSVNIRDNTKAFVDSAITDSAGKYIIGNIAPGNYGVYPVNADTTVTYKFTSPASMDSCMFAMNGESYTVDFIAEKISVPGFNDGQIVEYMYFQNGNVTRVESSRRMWIFFVPFPINGTYLFIDTYYGEQYVLQQYDPGYTVLAATVDNCLYWDVTYDNGKKRSFTTYHPLGTPENSMFYYNYNLSTGVLTERK